MRAKSQYHLVSSGRWRIACMADVWTRVIEDQILALVKTQPPSRHPQTMEVCLTADNREWQCYLKVYHPVAGSAVKDTFRHSKALRAFRQGIALAEAGFAAPVTIAAGEERHWRLLERAFLLSQKLPGKPAPHFLRDMLDRNEQQAVLRAKRTALKRIASVIRRFHQQGFVHGDLVATNILVSDGAPDGPDFYFMDNDRTRRFPSWLPQALWKRNLIQLNRMPLPGITLQDRMRFLRAYLNRQTLTRADRRFARWLERKTRQRRRECDGVDASGDFRKLMRWPPDVWRQADAGRLR